MTKLPFSPLADLTFNLQYKYMYCTCSATSELTNLELSASCQIADRITIGRILEGRLVVDPRTWSLRSYRALMIVVRLWLILCVGGYVIDPRVTDSYLAYRLTLQSSSFSEHNHCLIWHQRATNLMHEIEDNSRKCIFVLVLINFVKCKHSL
jgi:hypothetical protein